MRQLVYDLKNVKIALNLHAFGYPDPLWIYPFCFTSEKSNSLLVNSFPQAYKFYQEVTSSLQLRKEFGYQVGNAISTINYTANGEASDWMLAELGIFAVSVELGGRTAAEHNFFIEEAHALRNTVIENDRWIQGMLLFL